MLSETESYPAVCLDFDGVLHEYSSPWTTEDEIHDGPVEGAIQFIRALRAAHFRVVVLSSRARSPGGRLAIYKWLLKYGLRDHDFNYIKVTGEKVQAVLYIDDRGFHFQGEWPTIQFIKQFKPWNKGR